MLYSSHYAPDTWLLTSRIMNPPWVLGLPGLPWALPGFPWAFALTLGPLGACSRAWAQEPQKSFDNNPTDTAVYKTTDSLNDQTNRGHIGPIHLILGQI